MPYQRRPPHKPLSMRQAEAAAPALLGFIILLLIGYALAWLFGWL